MSSGLDSSLVTAPVNKSSGAYGCTFSGEANYSGSGDTLRCVFDSSQMHAAYLPYLFCLLGFSLEREGNFLHSSGSYSEGWCIYIEKSGVLHKATYDLPCAAELLQARLKTMHGKRLKI